MGGAMEIHNRVHRKDLPISHHYIRRFGQEGGRAAGANRIVSVADCEPRRSSVPALKDMHVMIPTMCGTIPSITINCMLVILVDGMLRHPDAIWARARSYAEEERLRTVLVLSRAVPR